MKEETQSDEIYGHYAPPVRQRLLQLRRLILETARKNAAVGDLQETLKWGQPSFMTVKPKTGTTIRIDKDKSEVSDVVLFVHCQTSLVSEWRVLYPHLCFGGNRSVHFRADEPLPEAEISQMVSMALRYHLYKAPRTVS
ncbi:DUF1801 domain-containing protein [Roseibium sp.]|uniref:DUF1801 domain-containing protein n=1 Tax=Roseibium sp. TaxID=1936156 RepID=UPI003B50EA1E